MQINLAINLEYSIFLTLLYTFASVLKSDSLIQVYYIFFCKKKGVYVTAESIPTESECRPHIEKALNTIKADIKGKYSQYSTPVVR